MHALFDSHPIRGQQFQTQGIRQGIRSILNVSQFDIIQIHQAYLSHLVPKLKIPKVLDMHDILSEFQYQTQISNRKFTHRFQAWLEWKKFRSMERRAVIQTDLCLTVSEPDRESLLRIIPNAPVTVIPNGVDTNYFHPQPSYIDETNLLFTGSMNYEPNSNGVRWFYKAIFPRIRHSFPKIHFNIVGWNPPPDILELNQDKNVTVTGFVDDIRPYLAKSTVVVVPIQIGSGTRLKILDAWAMGKAVVSTSIGAKGLKAIHCENLLLADTPEEFAQSITELLTDADKRCNLGIRARQTVEDDYTWRDIARKLNNAYELLMTPPIGRHA
jgi:glycosyltransferase involved in cell wall biosynthesis